MNGIRINCVRFIILLYSQHVVAYPSLSRGHFTHLNEGISYDISRSYGQKFENKNKKPLHLSQEITRAPIKMTNY